MYHYTAIQWIFFFYFYCFFGWCFESTYVSLKSRKLVNRGFCRGPFLPLYGSGAIMMLVVSMPFQDNLVLVYIAGCIGATVLEYVTGVTMEALFKVRYWDYSKNKFNFQGHICLGSSLAWGGLTILMTEFIHKPIEHLVLSIPDSILTPVTLVLTALIGADFALSFKAALDLRVIQVASPRVDAVISKVYNKSRSDCLELFRVGKVYVNGRLCENNSKPLEAGDVVNARGYGKFRISGEPHATRKGKLAIEAEVYP